MAINKLCKTLYEKKHKVIPTLSVHYQKYLFRFRNQFARLNLPLTSNDKKLLAFKNIHRGKRCFVLGNGPSLKISDLNKLTHEISFAFNKIYLAFDETAYRPTYYMVEDPEVCKNISDRLSDLGSFPKFIPWTFRRWARYASNLHIYRLDGTTYTEEDPDPRFTANPLDLYWGATVLYSAIQMAVYMGCSPIYLAGVDFNFKDSKQRDATNNTIMVSTGEQNHFHKDYRPVGEKWSAPRLELQEKAFRSIKRASETMGFEIYNATRGGKLEIFERRSIDSILS